MNLRDVTKSLIQLGWLAYTDEVGDKLTHYRLPDRITTIIYGVRKYGLEQHLEATLSATTDAFSNACGIIDPGDSGYSPLARNRKGLSYQVPEILEEHVRMVSDDAIAWAREQDLDKALLDHAALPTNAPGILPVWHLAALALLGDVAKLKSYQASFEAGDHLGFVPYIKKDYIDRAVSLAEEYAVRA